MSIEKTTKPVNEDCANQKEGEFVLQVREQANNVESLHNELENLEHALKQYSADEPRPEKEVDEDCANTDMGQAIGTLETNIQQVRVRLQKIISEFRG